MRSPNITHTHPLGVEGAVLQACAIALLLHQTPYTLARDTFLATLRAYVQSTMYRDRLEQVTGLLAGASSHEVVAQLGHGVAAYEAVPAAVYAFLRHPASFSDALRLAIGLGGDTDTIASMVGALSGAYLGEEAIPKGWRAKIEEAQRLRNVADALLFLSTMERP
jgi:poly(ADP-ribose) glycohydrolase ARH3